MKDIEVYSSIKKQIFQILLSLGLNNDVIQIIYNINIDDNMKQILYYHKNNLIYKTLDMNIFDTFFKTYSDEYIYHTYFKFTIPIDGYKWCIEQDKDMKRRYLLNSIIYIFDSDFIFCETKEGLLGALNTFQKIKVINHFTEIDMFEIYDSEDIFIIDDELMDELNISI